MMTKKKIMKEVVSMKARNEKVEKYGMFAAGGLVGASLLTVGNTLKLVSVTKAMKANNLYVAEQITGINRGISEIKEFLDVFTSDDDEDSV